jgi:signal transduction histidine kinase/ligand-binding sensor domain-containing protein
MEERSGACGAMSGRADLGAVPVMRTLGAVLGLLLICVPQASGERPPLHPLYARSYGSADGLFAGAIQAMAQDRNGHLWLGSDTGLIRFDGTTFLPWGKRGEPPLPGRTVLSLLSARDGSLWVGFSDAGGVTRIRDGQVVHYTAQHGLSADFVFALIEADDGAILAGTRRGLARFGGERWEFSGAEEGVPPAAVQALYRDRSRAIWAGTAAGVFRRAPGQRLFRRVSTGVVRVFSEDASGVMWATDPAKGSRRVALEGDTGAVEPALEGTGVSLLHDTRGTRWVGTDDRGLWTVRSSGERTLVERVGSPDQVASTLFKDREGNVWVGARGALVRYFAHSVTMVTSEHGLPSDTVRALEADPDAGVWVASGEGLTHLRLAQNAVEHASYRLDGARVTALHLDRRGALWVGTEHGVGTFANGRLSAVPFVPAGLGRVFALTVDPTGGLWLCHGGAASPVRVTASGPVELDQVPEMRGRSCTSVHTDRRGRVWVGFGDGSLVMHAEGRYRLLTPAEDLAGGSIYSFWEDARGVLWIGTSRGISRIEGERVTSALERNGLPEGHVTGIVADLAGNIWCAFPAGILRMPATQFERLATEPARILEHVAFDESDGLLHAPMLLGFPGATRSRDGRLWFQTARGLAVIDPMNLTPVPSFEARIDRVVADGRALPAMAPAVVLPPGTSRLEIEYGATTLSAAPKVRYAYQLDGVDRGWVEAGSRRQAFYTNLPPGPHSFRVRATVGGSEASSVWAFSIQPALYETGTFRAAVAVALLLSLWAAWRLRLRAVRGRFELVLEERARIGREIHDTLLQTLVGTTLKLESLALGGDLPSPVRASLQLIRRQLQESVVEARESILHLRSPSLAEIPLADAMRSSMATLSSGTQARVHVTVQGQSRALDPAMDQALLRVAEESARNAIRHGRAGRIGVVLDYQPDAVVLRVEDNGDGFDTGLLPDGGRLGVVGMSERVRRLGGTFHVSSAPGQGAQVTASIPLVPAAVT